MEPDPMTLALGCYLSLKTKIKDKVLVSKEGNIRLNYDRYYGADVSIHYVQWLRNKATFPNFFNLILFPNVHILS